MTGNMGNMLDLMLGSSSWDNPGLQMSKPHQVMSMISQNGVNSNNNEGTYNSADDFFYNDSLLELLHTWSLTQAVLQVITSTINDVLSGAEPTITTGDLNLDADVNKYIKEIGLTQNIMDNISDDMYFGQRAFWIDIESRSIVDIKDRRDFIMVKHLGNPYKFQILDKEVNDKETLLDYKKLGFIMFNPSMIKSKKSKDLNLTKDKDVNDLLVDLTYFRGNSILKGVLYLIFNHFLKSLLSQLLTMKNTVRPDLIQANVSNQASPEFNISDAINDIESLLNNGEYAFDIRSTNSFALIGTIYNQLLNSVKVVPGLSNYTNIEMIQQPDLTSKIENLNREVQDAQSQVINQLGIPEELFGGSSNRWEVISRSSRFFTLIKDLLNSVSNVYKHVSTNYIEYKYKGKVPKNIILKEIKLNIDTNNYLTSTASTSRMEILAMNIQKLTDTLGAISNFNDIQLLNKKEALIYIKNALSTTDGSLAKLINFDAMEGQTPGPSNGIQTQSGQGW